MMMITVGIFEWGCYITVCKNHSKSLNLQLLVQNSKETFYSNFQTLCK